MNWQTQASAAALCLSIAACSACSAGAAGSAASSPGAGTTLPAAKTAQAGCSVAATCYTPQQLQAAYGVSPLLQRGIDGHGQTVVLPELAETASDTQAGEITDIRQDMAAFDQMFGLPAPRLTVVSTFSGPADPWLANGEEVLDTEMAHAIAPGAALTIDLVKRTSLDNAASAVAASVAALHTGMSQGGTISLSPAGQIGGEHCVTRTQLASLNAALQAAAARHVTVVAATGDAGAAGEPCSLSTGLFGGPVANPVKEPILIASDPLVLSVGGTSLTASRATGAYGSETSFDLSHGGNTGTWFQASGGGFSHLFTRPSYQDGVPGIGTDRGVPDVSADADPGTGMMMVLTAGPGQRTIAQHGGTSASAPLWAGIIALADQYADRHLGFVNPAVYRIALSAQYHQAFHDVTTGDNTASFPSGTIAGYRAAPGWDPVTGWGSPNANVLVPLLASYGS
jgi:subtilase family serine protease